MSHPTPEEIYDNEFDEYATEDCQTCNPDLLGMVIVCPDDMCRGGEGCGEFDDPSCYRVCPDCKGASL